MWAPSGAPVSMFRSANPRAVATLRLAAICGAFVHQHGVSPLKKLVPDPPHVSPEKKAIRKAAEHLENAIFTAAAVLGPTGERDQILLDDALVEMRMSRALLLVALAAPPDKEAV